MEEPLRPELVYRLQSIYHGRVVVGSVEVKQVHRLQPENSTFSREMVRDTVVDL